MFIKKIALLTGLVFCLISAKALAQANNLPVLSPIGAQATSENVLLSVVISASDIESIPALTTSALPTGAVFTDNLNGTGSLSWTPTFLQSGVYSVTFFATDDSLAVDSEVVAITVTNVNQAPILALIGSQAVNENVLLSFGTTASDADGTTPTLSATGLPLGSSYTDNLNGTGSFSWTPDFTQAGVFNVTFFATDGAATDSEVVAITVTNVNQAPVQAAIGPQAVNENVLLSFVTTASDADGTTPTLSATGLPLGSSYTDNLNGTGSFSWTPDFTQAGIFNVTFFATDGAATDSEVVAITVTNVNQAPVQAAIGPQAVNENVLLSFGTTASDADGTTPTLSATGLPLGSSYTDNLNGTGSFSWTPDFTQAGVFNVTFFATDGAATDSEVVAITVTNVNQAPVQAAIGPQAVNENVLLAFGTTASDADGTTPTLSATGLPLGSSYTDNLNGTGSFSWTPDFTQAGIFNVTFFASDGAATDSEIVAITVTNVNQAPVLALIGAQAVNENVLLSFGTTASDADGTTPTLSATGLPLGSSYTDNLNGTGSFSWTPDFTQAGLYNVTFFATDGAATDSEIVAITVTNVNQAPVQAAIGAQAVNENVLLSFGTTASDADGTTPTLSATGLPLGSSYTDNLNGTGSFSWTPDFTQAGLYNVTFFATDGAATDSEIVAITVTNVNQAPILTAIGPQAIVEGSNLAFIVSAADADGPIPVLTTNALPSVASFTDNGDGTGSFSWTPLFNQSGAFSVTFFAADGSGGLDSEIVSITVTEFGNHTPALSLIGGQSVTEGVNLSFATAATDSDSTIAVMTTSALPSGATYIDNADGTGSFSWTPDFTQAGSYSVTFFAGDGLATDSEIVSINVFESGNQAPVQAAIGIKSVSEGAVLAFATSASDPDGTIPTLNATNLPVGASYTDNTNGTGSFSWTPAFNQAGIFNVTFISTDGVLADSEIVEITVLEAGNQSPVLSAIGAQGVAEGLNLNFNINSTDPDGTIPSVSASPLPAGATFIDNADGSGTFDWSPTFVQAGAYIVTFSASDGTVIDSEVVTITITEAGNQAPVLTAIGSQSVTEGAALSFATSAIDPDATIPTLSATGLPTGATYTDNLNGTGSLNWTPNFIQSGVYNVTFFTSDGLLNDSEIVSITVVDAGNQLPVLAIIGPQSVTEGINLNLPLTATNLDGPVPALSVSNAPTGAAFIDNGNGTATFDWTPTFTQSGSYLVIFIATDDSLTADSETVSITVNEAGNQAPILSAIGAQSVIEGALLSVSINAADPDLTIPALSVTGLPLGASFTDNTDGTGTLSWTPSFVQAGAYNVTFFANDGALSDSEIVTITVNDAGNQLPVLAVIGAQAGAEGLQLLVNVSASDLDQTTPALSVSTLPSGAAFTDNLDGTGTLDWTPGFVQSGVFNITFFAADGFATDSEIVTVTIVDAGNQLPVLASIGAQIVTENINLTFGTSATDIEGASPTMSATGIPAGASYLDNANGTGTFSWIPDFTQSGNYTVTFFATDDSLAVDSEVVTITVTDAGNQTPVLAAIGAQSILEGTLLSFSIAASDLDATIPTFSALPLPTGASFVDNLDGTGTFSWTPDLTQSGVVNLTFSATDGIATDSEVVAITVIEAGNQLPILASIGAQTVAEGINLNVPVTATDPEGGLPALTTTALPSGATFVDNGNGTGVFDWTPSFVQTGIYSVTFFSTDDSLAVDSEVVTITVTESGNQAPVLAAIGPQSGSEGALLTFATSASDPDGGFPALTASSLPAGATFTDNANGTGTFNWTPTFAQSGTYNVTFFASDGFANDSEIVAITINSAGNQAPVLAAIGAQSVTENVVLAFTVTGNDPDLTTPNLSATSLPAGATFVDNLDGTASFSWTPSFVQAGVYSVTFFASDGVLNDSEVVLITVTEAGNQIPLLATIGSRSTTEGVNLNFSSSATDPDGTIPLLSALSLPTGASYTDNSDGTGVFDWTPDFTQSGTFLIIFVASDGTVSDSETVSITVLEAGNQRPVQLAIGAKSALEGATMSFVVTSSDADGTFPAMTTTPLPIGAVYTDTGDGTAAFNWTPSFTQSGTYSVTFFSSDGLLNDSEIVSITINEAGNQPPVLATIGSQSVSEGVLLSVAISATDPDNINPALSIVGLPAGATFVDNGNGTGSFDWTPTFVQGGSYNVTFRASDGAIVDSEIIIITVTESGNQSPVLAVIGSQNVNEGIALSFVTSATDPDATTPTLTTGPLPTGAIYIDNGDGTAAFDWTPSFTQNGIYNITFFANDGLLSDSEIVTITVNEVGNQSPLLATIGSQFTTEGVLLSLVVTASDPDATIPGLSVTSLPIGATFADNFDGTGTLSWTPGFTQAGVYSVTFKASDGILLDSEIVSITVIEVGNQAPVLSAIGAQSTTEGLSLAFGVGATDPDGTTPVLTTSALPSGAIFADNGNGTGSFSWNPDFAQGGTYNIVFRASDGVITDSETVVITVLEAGNQPPVLATIGARGVLEGANLNFGISASDPDVTIPTLSVTSLPTGATFIDNLDGTGVFDWSPTFVQSGTYFVTFIATDGLSSDSEIVTVSVNESGNQAPILVSIGSKATLEGVNLNFATAASDPDATTPTLTASGLPIGASYIDNANGTGVFDWTPDFTQSGTYAITFFASDGALVDSEVVTISINEAGNQSPIMVAIGAQSVTEGASLAFGINASDPDGTTPVLTSTVLPGGASFVDNGNGTGTLSWSPDFTQSGSYTVTFFASDGILKDSQIVAITVLESGNQTPVLAAIGARSTNEGALLNFGLSASDPDGTTPSFTSSALPLGATLIDNGDGTATFDWTPDFTQSGAYSITFFAGDGLISDSEIVSVVVNEAGNQPPVLAAIGAQSITEGALLSVSITAIDADATIPGLSAVGLPLGAAFVDNLDGTASLTWTPLFTQAGVYSVTIRATDGLVTDSEIVSITVIDAGNQIPVLAAVGPQGTNEGILLSFAVSALDPDSTIPALSIAPIPTGATFTDNGDGTGAFNWTPDFTQSGSYSVTVFASDGVTLDSEIVLITVNELGNQAPILATIGAQSVTEGVALGFAVSASDVDLTIPALSTSLLPLGASFTDNLDGTGSFSWSPTFVQSGSFAVTFFASDGALIDSEIVTITVTEAGNQLPILAGIGAQSITEGLALAIAVSASDTDGIAPTLTTIGLPLGATFTDNLDGTGSLSWTPDFTQAGTFNITFFATDDSLAVDSEIVTVTVFDAGNQNPVLALIGPQSIVEGANLTFGASATDPDGTIPALTATGVPAGASFTDNLNGTASLNWTPTFTQSGSYSMTVFASDGVAIDSEVVSVTVNEAGNQPPVLAAIGSQSANEGVTLSFGISSSDLDGTIPTLSGLPLPSGATFTDNLDGTGTFSWTPDFTQAGIYLVTFAANDGVVVDSEVVSITINSAGNQVPILALIGPQNSNEGVNLNFALSATDADATIPALAAVGLPTGASLTDNLNGTATFDWTPDFTQAGSYIVVFTASDGVAIDSEVVTITINDAGNQAPVLTLIGSQNVTEGATLAFSINAADADGTIPSLNTTTLPLGATFVDNGDGTGAFNWTPDFTQAGGFSVTFRASDGVAIDSEVVTITVLEAGNQAPTLAAIGPRTTNEGVALAVAVSASDPDGSIPALTTSALPSGATFTDNTNGTGAFDWTPDFTQAGIYVVTFFASDGLVIDSEQVTITVNSAGNQAPVLAAIGAQTTTEGILLSFGASATDADGTIPALTTSALPLGATFTDNLDGTGSFSWAPDFTQAGLYSIVFRASDGIVNDSEIVSISVGDAGNQAPVLASIGPRSITENNLLSFIISTSDPDATIPALTANSLPSGATFIDNGDGTGTFSWTPDFTQAGVYSVTFVASDGILDDVEIVNITVLESGNQSPVLAAIGAQAIAENALLSFTVNSSDPDGTFPALTSSALPIGAVYTDNNNGTASFAWTPDFTQAGIYSVTFFASDGVLVDSEVVQITVAESGNQAPVLAAIGSQSSTEGLNLTFGVSATDPDATIPALSVGTLPIGAAFVDNADGTGTFNWTPNFTQSGVYSITFFASDGVALDSEIVTVSISESGNQIPVLATIGPRTTTENISLAFGLSALDADGTIPFFGATGLPLGAILTDNGNGTANFAWIPNFTQNGVYFVIFTASDGVAIDSETVSITVNEAGNQIPVLSAIGAQSVNEGANLNFAITAVDPDATIPTLTTSTLPTGATFVDNGTGSGTFDWSPSFVQAGVYSVTFFVSDGLLIDSEVVSITVNSAGNQAPVLAAIGPKGVSEGANLNFGISATDADATIPTLSATNVPLGATFTDNGDGTGGLDWTPNFTQSGTYVVTFFASDGIVSDSEIVTISVSEAGNQAPVIALIGAKSVTEGAALNFVVSVTDADGTIPPLTTSALPAGASFIDNGDGTGAFSWNPTFVQAGVYSVTFGASDGVLTDSEVVAITVIEAGNQLPVLAAIGAQTVAENVALGFALSATDAESIPTLTTTALPTGASFIDNGDGTGAFNWTPTFTQSGVYSVTFYATDVSLAVDSEIVTITVTEVGNQLPVLAAIGAQTVSENVALNLALSATDAETIPVLTSSALPLGATFVDNADGTAAFSWTPTFTQAGIYSVTFFATDAVLAVDSEVVVITVTESGNQLPVLVTIGAQSILENNALNVAISATDAESTPTLSTSALPTGATFVDNADGTGALSWTPTFLQSGVYNVTFFATDASTAVDSEIVTITVIEAGNQSPVLVAIGAQSIPENTLLSFIVSASDAESIPALTTSALPSGATFNDNGDGTGTFNWTPTFTQAGIYNINFFATDDSLAASGETVTITVVEVGNQLPILAFIGSQSVSENVTLNFPVSATDQESTPILTTTALPIGAVFTDNLNGTGSLTWTPDFTQAGIYSVTFFATDDSLAVDSEVVSITVVEAGNAAPPLAVADLSALIALDAMQLDWSPITLDTGGLATTVDHYVIYRGTSAYFTPTALDSIGFTGTATITFTDNNIGGGNVIGDTLVQYFYVIEAVDGFGRRSALSNRVGEFDYQIVVTSTTNFNLIAIPFANTGITTADQLISAIGSSNVLTLNNFVAASQSFESRFAAGFGVNFAVSVGGIYQVNASVNTVFSIAGAIPAPGAVSYPIITTATNDFNFLMIPFERQVDFSVAQDIINNVPGTLNTVNNFVAGSQSYQSRFSAGFGTNFPVTPGKPYQANAAANGSFPSP